MEKGIRIEVLEHTYDVVNPDRGILKGSRGRYIGTIPHPDRYSTRPVIEVSLDTGMRARIYKNLVKPA